MIPAAYSICGEQAGAIKSRRTETVITGGITAGLGIAKSTGAEVAKSVGSDRQPNGIGQVAPAFHHKGRIGRTGDPEPELTGGHARNLRLQSQRHRWHAAEGRTPARGS